MQQEKKCKMMVSIRCLTYNHEPYIKQCLEGFLMQRTNFQFEVIVHDDASSDDTASIIREYAEMYPDIIKPIFEKENLFSKQDGTLRLRKVVDSACKGKYIAMCEGDDCWHDPYKLQKQVDFLESNPEYGMSYTDYHLIDKEGKIKSDTFRHDFFCKHFASGDILFNLLVCNFPQTCTMVLRSGLKDELYPDFAFDYTTSVFYAGRSFVHYLEEDTACYRVQSRGVTGSGLLMSDLYRRKTYKTYLMATDYYLNGIFFRRKGVLHHKILFLLYAQLISPKYMLEYKDDVRKLFNRNILSYFYFLPAVIWKVYTFVLKRIRKGAN